VNVEAEGTAAPDRSWAHGNGVLTTANLGLIHFAFPDCQDRLKVIALEYSGMNITPLSQKALETPPYPIQKHRNHHNL